MSNTEKMFLFKFSTFLLLIVLFCVLLCSSVKCDGAHNGEARSRRRSDSGAHDSSHDKGKIYLDNSNFFDFQSKLGNSPTIDPDSVYNGILDPNNIAIHVGQNFVNFADAHKHKA